MAGGKGTRFGSSLPKQFLTLHGKPVLLHTIEKFFEYAPEIQIVLVLPEDDIQRWEEIASKYGFTKSLTLQEGGATRFQSVKKGLAKIQEDGFVAIHDGVRPLVTTNTIRESFQLAALHGSAIACVSVRESLRMLQGANNSGKNETLAIDRSR